ncbi:conserved hypothetical protein [Bacteroidetes oral taxon 274 str. F0058]|nr:conserved hypothetical protein [Bacteroidetes oral taxon 274 str. F0058]
MKCITMQKYKGRELALLVFESAMAVFYVLAGIGLLMWKRADTVIQSSAIRIAVAVILLLYGIFRVYRAIKKLF